MSLAHIDVVAGIIFSPDKARVLLTLRKPEQHQGSCWEFPGGKIESLESTEQALIRELDEELGIQVTDCRPFYRVEHEYVDKMVRLQFWQVSAFDGIPRGRENQQFEWFAIEALKGLKFPEANLPVVKKLLDACKT